MIISSSSSIIDCSPLTKTQGTSNPPPAPPAVEDSAQGQKGHTLSQAGDHRAGRTLTQGIRLQSLLRPRAKVLLFGPRYCEGKENRSIFIFFKSRILFHTRGVGTVSEPRELKHLLPASCVARSPLRVPARRRPPHLPARY